MKRIFLILVACLLVSGVSAFPAKVGFELSDLGSVSELDNSDGSSIKVSIHEVGGALVDSRFASKGVYEAGSVISVAGGTFDLSENTDYIYNLSTEYENYYYDFSTGSGYSGDKLVTKLGFELDNLDGINWLDNSDGDSVVISVQNSSGVVVRRNASVGIYHAGSTIPMEGDKYNLSFNSEYTLNLSTDYGDFFYNFTTPRIYELTYNAGSNGFISGSTSQTVSYGGSGTEVTAVANSGYEFDGWSDGVQSASRTDSDVTSDLSVTASFTEAPYIIDQSTNLMWQEMQAESSLSWYNAGTYCSNLDLGGYTDWRLPTCESGDEDSNCELRVGYYNNNGLDWPCRTYWSRTTNPDATDHAYGFSTSLTLEVYSIPKAYERYVRCVRDN